MATTYPDALALDVAPAGRGTPLFRLSLTIADDFILLDAGGYLLTLEDASTAAGCIVTLDIAAVDPPSGTSTPDSLLVPAGGSDMLWLDAPGELHGIMRAGTGELYIGRRL